MKLTNRIITSILFYMEKRKIEFIIQYGVVRKGILGGCLSLLLYYGTLILYLKEVPPTQLEVVIRLGLLVILGGLEAYFEWIFINRINQVDEPDRNQSVKWLYYVYNGIVGFGLFLAVILTEYTPDNLQNMMAYVFMLTVAGFVFSNLSWYSGYYKTVEAMKDHLEELKESRR